MAKINSPERHLEYSKDFKVKVVHLTNMEGVQIKQIAEALGLHPIMLSRWRQEYREGRLVAEPTRKICMVLKEPRPKQKKLSEMAKLRKQNERLKKENALLKKYQRYLAEVRKNASDS